MQRERCHNWQGLEPVGSRNSKFWHSTPAIETRTTVVVSIDDVLRGDLGHSPAGTSHGTRPASPFALGKLLTL